MLFAIPIALAGWYHDPLPYAQALVRAATVPLAVAGLTVLVQHLDFERIDAWRVAVIAGPLLLAIYLAYYAVDHATIVGGLLIAGLALAVIAAPAAEQIARDPTVTLVLIALLTGQFMFLYVDYGAIRRVGPIPAAALVLGLRLVSASAALAAVLLVARVLVSKPVVSGFSRTSGPSEGGRHIGFETAALLAAQLAYYAIDAFADYRLRAAHGALVITLVFSLAILLRGTADRHATFGRIAIVGVFGLALIQFATFHHDYLGEFQARGSADIEGNMRGAFESVIERTNHQTVPAIYLGKIGPYYYGGLFWKFYLIKHQREELLERTIAEMEFRPDRIRALPPGSIVITSPSRQIDGDIDTLVAEGVVTRRELLKAPDAAPIFWILEIRGA